MSASRYQGPGKFHQVFGMFLLFSGGLLLYLANLENSKWHRLHDGGTKVVAEVSDKHVIHSEATRSSSSRTYHRVFFQPPEDLDAKVAELWSRTSEATRYPDSVSLFDDWGNRLWEDFSAEAYGQIAIGQQFDLLIDGNESMRFVPGGPPGGWTLPIVLVITGVLVLILGIYKRITFFRDEARREEKRRARREGVPAGAAPLLLCLLAGGGVTAQEREQEPPPHIVFLFADDLGWTDLSTGRANDGNGSPYHKTPNLDALAAAGACFPNAYSNGPNCAPTRAALWSGQWAARTGIYTVGSGNRGKPKFRKLDAAPNETVLDPAVVTLAETMKAAGYATAHFGKWHLGSKKHGASPTEQGFDHQAGGDHRGGVGRLRHFADEDGAFAIPGLPANGKPRQFMADRLTDEALAWMAEVRQPMFCCVSHYSVHTPIQAPQADIEATPEVRGKASRHRNRRYAAMLKNLDDNCGRVLEFLTKTDDPVRPGQKLIANTVVVFTSDNGGLGGYHAAGIAGGQEITNQYPLRAGKGSLHEGGTRVPFIVRWDGKVRPGSIDRTMLQSFDLYPTFAGVAQAALPDGQKLDGVDLSPRWNLEPAAVPERSLFWHFPGYLEANGKLGTWRTTPATSMRRGNWKLIYWYELQTWSLYDLDANVGESKNLALWEKDTLRAMAQEMRTWLEETKAVMPRKVGGGPVALPAVPE